MDSKNFPPNVAQRCWRYSRILLLALGIVFFGNQEAYASHFSGADITYECLGNNQYLVTLTLYRDCDGVGMSTQEFLNMSSASCGLNPAGVALQRDTFYEVSQLCPSALSQSSCGGSGLYPGYEVHVYSGIITLPANCVDWIISWSSCCRNGAITTLTSSGSMYVEAMINSTLCNSSPTFTTIPTPYFCAGQCYDYNHGAFDPDNDSLRYALTCPLQGPNNCIPNVAGLSPTQPLFTNPPNSFQFNQFTGQMSFCTANGQQQFAVAAVTVFQIANGDTVGYVQRDIQMIVLNNANCTSPVSSNNPTVFSGGSFDTTGNTFIVCAGETLIFDLTLTDPDGDTIQINPANTNLDQVFGANNWTIFTNTNPPFSHDSLQMFVQIQAVPSNIGVSQFTIGVTDGACPIPGDQILGFNLIIPGVEVTASDTTICPGIAQQIQMNANSFSSVGSLASGTFSWTQISGPPITFSNDTIPDPIVSVPSATTSGDSIVLQVTFTTIPDPVTGTQCVTTDDVVIYLQALPLSLWLYASDTSLCQNMELDTISFNTAIAGPGIDLVNGTYSWQANPASYLTGLTSTTINNPDAIISGGPGDSVTYTVTYTYGLCVGSDDVTLYYREGIPQLSATMDTICPGDTTVLTGFLSDSVSVSDPSACSTYTVNPITFAPVAGSGTNVPLSDDQLSGALPIGFNFEFYCNSYSQFHISSNGYITFDGAAGQGCCTGQNIPTANNPNNYIALAWEDLNPASGGNIQYFTVGVAPNRMLVVNYNNVPRFGGANNVTGQIVLHESSNYIDIHTTTVQPDGNTTQGIENFDGTTGIAAPGRNASQWSATNDAYRFAPGIAFLFGPITYNWMPGFSVSNPNDYTTDAFPQGTTTYVLEINEKGCIMTDSIEIFVNSQIPPPTLSCGTPANQATTVLFEWGGSPGATGWEYSIDSGLTWIPAPLQDSSLLVTGLTNGDCANILVRALGGAGPCPTNAATYLECCTTPCPMPNTSLVANLNCNGSSDGTITVSVSGGVLGDHPNFSGTLFDTSGAQIGATINDPASLVFNGLAAGVYYAYLTDTFGCFTYSDTVVVTEPDSLIVSLDSTTLTTCYNDNDGTASVSPAGGTPTYTWLWDAAANNQTTPTATGLGVGNYDVVLSDANGCTDTLNVQVSAPFPNAPSVTLTSTASGTCTGDGTATVFSTFNMVGNANNYTYQWSGSAATGPTATGLTPGVHTVTVTDLNGCMATASTTITGTPTVQVTGTPSINPGCGASDGQITAAASGDTTGYTYQWTPNANGQTTALVTGLPIGNYCVTVTGASNGCSDTACVTLVNNSTLNITGINGIDPSCGGADGSATVLSTGGTGALTFVWSNGDTTQTASGLPAGTHTVTVTDPATNCSDIASVSFTDAPLAASFTSITNASCNLSNGTATVTATGAPGPFTYLWSDGQTNATAVGLAPGNYDVTVSYQGCDVVLTNLSITNDVLSISISTTDDINCLPSVDANATVNVLTGTNPTFAWIGPNGFTDTAQTINALDGGIYIVTATSGTCVVTQSITIVDVVLTIDPWITAPGTDLATIQVNTQASIDGNVTTNHANPVYSWTEETPGIVTITDPSIPATSATGTIGGDTWLYFTATAGPCSVTDSIFVTVESYLGMPTAFTPNGDGINDFFGPAGLTMSDKVFKFKVYNRWGQLLYDDNTNHSWDGTFNGVPQPTDVYIYVFCYVPDGAAEPIEIRGEFTLIR